MRLAKLVYLNHRVVQLGKLGGFLRLSGQRHDGYWF